MVSLQLLEHPLHDHVLLVQLFILVLAFDQLLLLLQHERGFLQSLLPLPTDVFLEVQVQPGIIQTQGALDQGPSFAGTKETFGVFALWAEPVAGIALPLIGRNPGEANAANVDQDVTKMTVNEAVLFLVLAGIADLAPELAGELLIDGSGEA